MLLLDDNLSGARLADAYEDNASDLFRQHAAALGGELDEGAHGGRHLTFPDHMMFKAAWNTRLTAETADAAIDDTIAWFTSRGASSFGWWTHASTTPDDIGQRLMARGFTPLNTRGVLDPAVPSTAQGSPVMAADLRVLDDSALSKAPPGFRVAPVETEADLTAFAYIVGETFLGNPLVGNAWAEATRYVGIGRTPWRLYLGLLDGEPVATNVVTEGGGIVGVWNIGTLAAHRGKGIGAAVTLAPLLEARAQGYRYAGLFASLLGAPVYERLGFRFTGTKLNRYVWQATP